jgi:DNA-binding NtrC family response regulator
MTKTVFLVDDDIDLVEQNTMVLEEMGYNVVSAHTGQAALKKLDSIKPDIMLLDVMMEHRTAGFVLAREIGKKHPNIPIIIISGDPDKVNWLGESGNAWNQVIKFLDKPIKPTVLAEEVSKVVQL